MTDGFGFNAEETSASEAGRTLANLNADDTGAFFLFDFPKIHQTRPRSKVTSASTTQTQPAPISAAVGMLTAVTVNKIKRLHITGTSAALQEQFCLVYNTASAHKRLSPPDRPG